jgi:hypothetical protein
LDKARAHCNQKIEDALFDIYNYASKREYNQPFKECDRLTSLQEELEKNAVILEKTERTTVCKSKLSIEARARNKALLSRKELNLAVLLNRIPAKKLREYNKYPSAFRIGFIHSILEKEFDIASATITDIGFLGLFLKSLLQILYRYANKIEKNNNDKNEFVTLIEKLITAFIYRPITLQKIIQILISSKKVRYKMSNKMNRMMQMLNLPIMKKTIQCPSKTLMLQQNVQRKHPLQKILLLPQLSSRALPINVVF